MQGAIPSDPTYQGHDERSASPSDHRHHVRIARLLNTLERDIPGMITASADPASFWKVFAEAADEIEHAAGSNEWTFVHQRLDEMLAAADILASAEQQRTSAAFAGSNTDIVNRMLRNPGKNGPTRQNQLPNASGRGSWTR